MFCFSPCSVHPIASHPLRVTIIIRFYSRFILTLFFIHFSPSHFLHLKIYPEITPFQYLYMVSIPFYNFIILWWMQYSFFNQSLIDGHLNCFQSLQINLSEQSYKYVTLYFCSVSFSQSPKNQSINEYVICLKLLNFPL